jgi:hypothetical protein
MAPLMREAFLSDEHLNPAADLDRGLAGRSSSVSGASEPNGPGAPNGTARGRFSSMPGPALRAIRWVAVIGALVVGLASISHRLAASDAKASQSGGAETATALRVEPASPASDARLGCRFAHRWHKRWLKIHRAISTNDPNDDGTSSDPDDDDDTSENLNCDDETEAQVVACFTGVALYTIASETASIPSPSETHSLLFLELQRIRC